MQIEKVQRRITKRLCGLRDLEYPKRLNRLCLLSLELRLLHLDLMLSYKIVFGLIHAKFSDFFQCNNRANTRGHAYNLYRSQYTKSARTSFFANRIVNVWNSLPATVDFHSLAAFMRTVKRADLSALMLCNCTWCVLFIAFIFLSYILIMLALFCAILLFCGHLPVQEFLPWCSSSMTEINWNWKCQVVVTGYCLINDIVRTNSSSWDYKISAGPLRAMVAVTTLSKVVLDVPYRHNVMDSCNYNMNYWFIEGASVCATPFRRVLQLTWRATDSLRPRDSVPLYKSRARVQHAPKQVDIRDVNCSRFREHWLSSPRKIRMNTRQR